MYKLLRRNDIKAEHLIVCEHTLFLGWCARTHFFSKKPVYAHIRYDFLLLLQKILIGKSFKFKF
jgi:hypothetical protein